MIGYRRDVVFKNLRRAFPEKKEEERKKIAKRFYHNLVDTFIETIKMISASEKFIEKRVQGNWDLVNQLQVSGRSVQLHLGHNFNWEWANNVGAKKFNFLFLVVYMPIKNEILDKLFYKLRSRSGSRLLPATKMREAFLPYRDKQYILALAADQNPGSPQTSWWFDFLEKPAPFVKGPEKGARVNNTIVVFAFIQKPKRGYYEVIFKIAEENPASLPEGELTKKFVRYLEDVIRTYPDMWLWSHRRWKWEWKEEYGKIIK